MFERNSDLITLLTNLRVSCHRKCDGKSLLNRIKFVQSHSENSLSLKSTSSLQKSLNIHLIEKQHSQADRPLATLLSFCPRDRKATEVKIHSLLKTCDFQGPKDARGTPTLYDTFTILQNLPILNPYALSDELLFLILPPSFVCSISWWNRIDSSHYLPWELLRTQGSWMTCISTPGKRCLHVRFWVRMINLELDTGIDRYCISYNKSFPSHNGFFKHIPGCS